MDEDAVAQQPLRSNRDQIVVVNLFARSSSILVDYDVFLMRPDGRMNFADIKRRFHLELAYSLDGKVFVLDEEEKASVIDQLAQNFVLNISASPGACF